MAQILQEWRQQGVICDTNYPYASPVVLVDKTNGKKRLCVDFQKLNSQTVSQPYPMADIDLQLGELAHGRIFCVLDLFTGYLQIPLTEAAKEKTAFVTPDEKAMFQCIPFGLRNAPAEFCKLMSKVFGELRRKGIVQWYMDDIIFPASYWTDMCSRLQQVLMKTCAANLTLNPNKCVFGADELDYLGFTISAGQIRPGRKVLAIKNYSTPCSVHEVRRFLGLAGYFRRFI